MRKISQKLNDVQFDVWYDQHKGVCSIKNEGSAGQMEPQGMLRVFMRSEEQYKLKYSGYLRDGDSKSYSSVANADPPVYEGVSVVKLECCGHVQKRMGKRLIDKVAEMKSKPFREGGGGVTKG